MRGTSESDDSHTVLIAGCGDLGTEVGLRFLGQGWRAIGLRRTVGLPRPPLESVTGDLTKDLTAVFGRLPPRVDALVFAPTAGDRSAEAYRSTYRDGLHHVLEALDAVGRTPARVLSVSSTAVYGVADGGDVDERTPTRPTSPTGRVLVEAEATLHARRPDAVSLRLAGIYGPGRTRLLEQVRDGTAVLPRSATFTNRIHRDDAAAAVVHLVTKVETPAPVYVGADNDPADRREVLVFLAEALGAPAPPSGDDRRSRGSNKRCRNDALVSTGFAFAYPTYREGYRAVLSGAGVRHP